MRVELHQTNRMAGIELTDTLESKPVVTYQHMLMLGLLQPCMSAVSFNGVIAGSVFSEQAQRDRPIHTHRSTVNVFMRECEVRSTSDRLLQLLHLCTKKKKVVRSNELNDTCSERWHLNQNVVGAFINRSIRVCGCQPRGDSFCGAANNYRAVSTSLPMVTEIGQ